MRFGVAALAAFLLTPAQAQLLQDAVPDCKRGPRIERACRLDCRAEAAMDQAYETSAWRWKLRQCLNVCDAIRTALDECKVRKR